MKQPAIIPSRIMSSRKTYHWTWTGRRKNQKPHLVLHADPEKGSCRRRHHRPDGTPA